LESSSEAVVLVTTYAPPDAADVLRAAMAAAGAGRLGEYDACAFTGTGTGYFEPRAAARPAVTAGSSGVPEIRLEMLAPPSRADAVLGAARTAHPYEEPVIVAAPGKRARGVARLGRVCTWREGATLGELAAHVSAALGTSCRVWGDATRLVERIAVANGSAGSLIDDARRQADTLVAGEVRYHDALAAAASGLAIIEAGHDATEWPLVRVLAEYVREAVGDAVAVTEESPAVGWWTMEEPNV
jgi:putative NIF3 family GTP cyclohydrolase 1 type 2